MVNGVSVLDVPNLTISKEDEDNNYYVCHLNGLKMQVSVKYLMSIQMF